MLTRIRWKEMLASLAAGHSLVPLGDNGPTLRQLSERVWTLRTREAARVAPRPQAVSPRGARSTGIGAQAPAAGPRS
jgi:hypothetical protein